MKKALLRKEYATIYLDQEHQVLFEEWNGVAMPEEFKQTLTEKLDLYKKLCADSKNSIHWIANLNGMRGLSPETILWANEVFHPMLYPAGIKKIAYLVPEPVFYELPDDQINDGLDQAGKITIAYFTEYNQAVNWLSGVGEISI